MNVQGLRPWYLVGKKDSNTPQKDLNNLICHSVYREEFEIIDIHKGSHFLYNKKLDITTFLVKENLERYMVKKSPNYNQYWAKLNEC